MTLPVLAVIPARGGSKGIPRKNLADLCGRPLVAWSIETGRQLLSAGVVARCIVSTDDPEIAEVSRGLGAEVPFLRPAEISGDQSKSIDAILHAVDWAESEGLRPEAVLLLQPTSPQRDAKAIADAIPRFLAQNRADSLISCYREDYVCELVMYRDAGDGYLQPLRPEHNRGVRRQEHGATMVRNGAVYLTRVSHLRTRRSVICDRPMLLQMSKMASVDLDTPEDLEILRSLACR